mmetsp:Transcript_11443/g.24769  ORF Transcript_11443/g.24769 Transcript_11443/m.24769 type:complete len:252 (+) Transcript_11443:917-1672(+)
MDSSVWSYVFSSFSSSVVTLPLTDSFMSTRLSSVHHNLNRQGMPIFDGRCKSSATADAPVKGKILVIIRKRVCRSFVKSSDISIIPPVIATTVTALKISSSVSSVVSPRRMQSGSLCHHLCPRFDLVIELRIIARSEGSVELSHDGSGKAGYHVGPVSALIRIPSMYPTAFPSGQPHPIMKVAGPAPARRHRSARSIPSARDILKSYLPLPFSTAAYRKSNLRHSKPQTVVALLKILNACSLTWGFVASSP